MGKKKRESTIKIVKRLPNVQNILTSQYVRLKTNSLFKIG